MQPILESLAIHLIRSGGSKLVDTRIILPNRRSGLFLQRHMARHITQAGWLPQICSINDYVNEESVLRSSDSIDLLFTLYDVYKSHVSNPEPLDEFYHWGEIMLRDFDEIDKYLVDAQMLFTNIIDLKELEEPLAGLEPDQVTFIRQFWEGFHEGDSTKEKEHFLRTWSLLPVLYRLLKDELLSRGEGYQGMQYREIAERIDRGEMADSMNLRTIVIGFNALNGCEKQIFTWLKKHGAEFYWDYDHQYSDDTTSEAGRFLRENMKEFPPHSKIEEFRGLKSEKEVRIFELPTDVLQAKTVHRILDEKEPVSVSECTDTALVLCDEELLMPVIMSLPESVEEINVTMGYPMKNTPVFSFIDALLRLQHNLRLDSKGLEHFYHKDVTSVLLHPYMRTVEDSSNHPVLDEITKSNLITVERKIFKGELEKQIFRKVTGGKDLLTYFRQIVEQILENVSELTDKLHQELDREFIFQLLIHLNKLENLINSRTDISSGMMDRLLRKIVSVLRVPFEGEPLFRAAGYGYS